MRTYNKMYYNIFRYEIIVDKKYFSINYPMGHMGQQTQGGQGTKSDHIKAPAWGACV